jgi:Major Facilitator Superfamily
VPAATLQAMSALSARRLWSTGAVITAAAIFGLTYSLSAPLIAVDLSARGYSGAFIGANAAMHAVGVLLIASFLPRIASSIGARQLTLAALAVSAVVLALFPFAPSVYCQQRAMQLISTLMLGAIVLQLPIGWIADRVDRRRLALTLAVLSAAGALVWPYVLGETWLTFAVIFVWGGLFVGIYTVMLAMVGARYKGGELVGIYGAMGFAWGAGALIGPSSAGVAINMSARFGLPGFVALSCALFALFMLLSRREARGRAP